MATDQELLDSIDAAIAGNPTGVTQHTIHGRSVTRMSLKDLLDARAQIAARQARVNRDSMFAGARPRKPS